MSGIAMSFSARECPIGQRIAVIWFMCGEGPLGANSIKKVSVPFRWVSSPVFETGLLQPS